MLPGKPGIATGYAMAYPYNSQSPKNALLTKPKCTKKTTTLKSIHRKKYPAYTTRKTVERHYPI